MNIALLGFGTVGKAFYELTLGRSDLRVTSVLSRRPRPELPCTVTNDFDEIVRDRSVGIVVEVMGGLEPAYRYICAAMRAGKHVVTANKQLVCAHYDELLELARECGVSLRCTAAAGGGIPWLTSLSRAARLDEITAVGGILNGTTNYMLSAMTASGVDYTTCLREAQALGYAEADPTADVEGYDAMYKLSILSSLAFHTKVPYGKVCREGISSVDKVDIAFGKQLGYTLKLLAIGKNTDKGIEVRVHPTFIKNSHPLAGVSDSFNAVYLKGDAMDDVMLYGRGAGALPTGSSVVSDVIYAATHSEVKYSTFKNTAAADKDTKFVSDFESAYYLRLAAEDRAGVLAKVSGILARYGVSIVELVQKGNAELPEGETEAGFGADTSAAEERVPLILVTHGTTENSIRGAVAKINASGIANVEALIRVEA